LRSGGQEPAGQPPPQSRHASHRRRAGRPATAAEPAGQPPPQSRQASHRRRSRQVHTPSRSGVTWASPASSPPGLRPRRVMAGAGFGAHSGDSRGGFWAAGRAVDDAGVEPCNCSAGSMAAPGSVRGCAQPPSCPRQPVDVGSQDLPSGLLSGAEHVGEHAERACLHRTPDLAAGRRH
jgi:hypothetical protein